MVLLQTDLATAEAIFGSVFSLGCRLKDMKQHLGILCLILVSPTPPLLWDAEPLDNVLLSEHNILLILLPSKRSGYSESRT